MFRKAFLILTISSLLAPTLYAKNLNSWIDEPTMGNLLQKATEQVNDICAPLPQLDGTRFQSMTSSATMLPAENFKGGSYYGQIHILAAESKPYHYAETYHAQLAGLQDPAAKDYLIRWTNIDNARTILLKDADLLEISDKEVFVDGTKLKDEEESLKEEYDDLKAEVDQYNQQCAGQPANEFCSNWYKDLSARIADFKKRAAEHNEKVKAWQPRKSELDKSVNEWVTKVGSWEQIIRAFIADVKEYLKDTGKCSPERHEELQDQVNAWCKVLNQPYACRQWHPMDPAQDCEAWHTIYILNRGCYNARHAINEECYGGGDPTHQYEESEALKRANFCNELILKHCSKSASNWGRRFKFGIESAGNNFYIPY